MNGLVSYSEQKKIVTALFDQVGLTSVLMKSS